ncbi:unnamed protein product [Sphagnum jensenii]|uniref:Uncharacterized protein n=1 Tax=Sphagnum jensenii TaxID=128206 RepID=A0ABP1A513_9BRYO
MKEIEDVNVKTPNGIKADAPNLVVKPPPSRTFFFPVRYVKTLTGSRSIRISQKPQGRTKYLAHEDAKKRKMEAEGGSEVAETLHWCGEKEAMACKSLVTMGDGARLVG